MKRYVSYDIKSTNSYNELYSFLKEIKAVQVTESTYLTNSSLNLDDFCTKLKNFTQIGDTVIVISVNIENQVFHRKVR